MKDSDLVNDIASIDNLMLAWGKLEGEMSSSDDWRDIMELYAYKFTLKDNLIDLQDRLLKGTYRMQALKPLPFPKGCKRDDKGNVAELRVRQYFHVAVEDQLVWIAYFNVIGQYAELKMPGWSFGNRSDVRVWYKEVEGKRVLQVGNYRNTKDRIYKKWGQSWPHYRRLLALTIKMMSVKKTHGGSQAAESDLNDDERQLLENNERFEEQKIPYFEKGYFDVLPGERLYWAGIDLEKFYPNINRSLLVDNLKRIVYPNRQSDEFWALTNTLLDFKVDVEGFSPEELTAMKLDEAGLFANGIPTGLLVAGILANIAMLGIDGQVTDWLKENHQVAHFRYVDDHVVLAQSQEALAEWVKRYVELLGKNGFSVNADKIEPEGVGLLLDENSSDSDVCLEGLDPAYPSPLMTLTLQKVSQMAEMNTEQLSKTEFDMLFADLQELLVMDIPDQEIKKETRISYAVTMLSRILVHGDVDYEELGRLKQELRKLISDKLYGKDDDKLSEEQLKNKRLWLDWFYQDEVYPEEHPATEGVQESVLASVKETVTRINAICERSKANQGRKLRYIYDLIVKALMEVPERTRVWIRMLQFCYHNLPERLEDVYGLLDSPTVRERLHPLDIEYLRMLLITKLAEMYIKGVARQSVKEGNKQTEKLLTGIMLGTAENESQRKYYVNESYQYVAHVLKLGKLLTDMEAVSFVKQPLFFGKTVDSDFWLLYAMQFVPEDETVRNEAIHTILPYIETSSPFYAPLFLKCMSNMEFQTESVAGGALDSELVQYLKRHYLGVDVYRSFSKEYRDVIGGLLDLGGIDDTPEGYVSLSEWIFYLVELTNRNDVSKQLMDNLEYMALKVTRSVIKTMDDNHKDIFNVFENRYINLFNLCIKRECLEKVEDSGYWDGVDEITIYNSVFNPRSRFPVDNTLLPLEFRDVYDIGVILLQMLVLDHLPSDYLVEPEYGYKWESHIRKLMGQGYMSFYTYMTLMSCLSKRNRETILIKKQSEGSVRNDYDLDAPEIYSLPKMLEYVEEDILLLKTNRISLPDNKFRILSEVSLEPFRTFEKRVGGKDEDKMSLEKYMKVDIIQTNLDHRQAWNDLRADGYLITKSEMKKCWSEIVIFFKQIMELGPTERPQLVVLPEFSFDKDYYGQLKKLSDKSGCVVIAGRNFLKTHDDKIMNKAVVFVPYKWPNGQGNTAVSAFEFGKYFFAKIEEKFIQKVGYTPLPYDKMYLVNTGRYGKMGLAICADFYDIERFAVYRGRIQHLFIIAYNKDVKSFYHLAEAISRIVFCNVVICNTGFYGGSIAFAPYKEDYKRYIYRHEGGNLFTNQIVLLPVAALHYAQHHDDDTLFRTQPPGFVAI